jgi:ketosteroid isomerase-like protein
LRGPGTRGPRRDPTANADIDQIDLANQAFYGAFEDRDLEAMSQLWEHSDRVTCTHPGWATLRGWGQVAASFFALFQNDQHLQFILTNSAASSVGDVAWVSVDENILSDAQPATTVAALNIFSRTPGGPWRLVAHHASPVTADAEFDTDGDAD